MHPSKLKSDVLPSHQLGDALTDEVLALCRRAYEEEISGYLRDIGPGRHVLLHRDGRLVSHAMFVVRRLYVGGDLELDAAYVELVATEPAEQNQGYGSAVMQRLIEEVDAFDLAALSAAEPTFYEQLGWEFWRGPLFVRTAAGPEASPDESVMVYRLPRTPTSLDLSEPLSIDWRPGEVW